MEYRDIIRKQEKKLDKKLDRRDFIKAVITDALGNTTGAGSIWADRNTRRVWIQENGSASLSQVPCYRIMPTIGLGVIVGYEPYSTIREVLATDREFYGPTNSTGTSYESPSNEDMLPGGRLQLWLDPRLLQPLAVYPADALNVNVVEGSYPYNGVRKSFAGQINYDLSAYQPAGPNEHCLVGLYLDASNNLQVVAGATVSTAVTAPEPSWPSGSFLLAVVDLDDTQTSLSLADDIQDRRMAWSDEKTAPIDAQYLTLATNSVLTQERVFTPSLPLSGSDGGAGNPYTLSVNAATESASGVAELATQAETNTGTDDARIVTPLKLANWTGAKSGWPVAGKAMINNVEYDTIQLAIDAMAAGDIIKVGQGTDSGGIVPDTAGSIVGLSPVETIITASANDSITVDNSAGTDNLTLENLTIANTGAGTSVACVQSNKDGLRLDNLDIKKVSGTPTNSTGVAVYGGSGAGTYLLNCRISVTTGTNKYGVYASTAACNIVIEGGEINAATADIYIGHASSVVELRGVKLLGGGINNAAGGTVKGWYYDSNNNLKAIDTTSDIFPQASLNGLNKRFENLFGDDVPANTYKWTGRLFTPNNFAGDMAGYQDSQASPYSYGGTPGGFSLTLGASSGAQSNARAHWLRMYNSGAADVTYNQWTSSTAKTRYDTIISLTPYTAVADTLVYEIRFWDVQSPGAGHKYWAIRWVWEATTSPQFPLQVSTWYGTGVTFTATDGTRTSKSAWIPGLDYSLYAVLSAGGTFSYGWSVLDGSPVTSGGPAVAGYPSNFKTVRHYCFPQYNELYIDEIRISG